MQRALEIPAAPPVGWRSRFGFEHVVMGASALRFSCWSSYRSRWLCYVRGPEGIIVALAEELS